MARHPEVSGDADAAVSDAGAPASTDPSAWARGLGRAGLVPFVALAAALWLAPPTAAPWAQVALVAYGATIASFLGGIHWGLAMRAGRVPAATLLWGVVPSLVAWLGLLLAPPAGLLLLSALLWTCYAADRVAYPRFQVDAWLPLRLQLTWVASGSCLAGMAALLQSRP